MKRFVCIFLAFIMAFTFIACNKNVENAEKTANEKTSSDTSNDGKEQETLKSDGKTLVVFYSATGNTKVAAERIADVLKAAIFEIEPRQPYSSEDLDWNNENSRVNIEHEDETKRDVALEKTTPQNWEQYETVYIGYPIWWGIAAWPVSSFVKSNNFGEKTVIPFCTSASSELGSSVELLKSQSISGKWTDGKRFSSNVSNEEIDEWVSEIAVN